MPPCPASALRPTRVLFALAIMLLTVLTLLPAGARAAGDVRFGTWSPNEPYWGSVAGVDALQANTGRDVEIVNWYQNWGGGSWIASVQPHLVRAVTASGRTPLLTWEPWDPALGVDQPAFQLSRIADGSHDAYIASFARGIRDLGTSVYLRPMHEMNGNWYPWSGGVNANTPDDYIRAWRRMHGIFAAQGATNVRWVWSPNNVDTSPARPMEAFYPGAAYVDVLGVDGYNWGSAAPEFGGWLTFAQVFQNAYDRLKALGPQPIWIAEVGAAPEGGDKAAWIRDMFSRADEMDRLEAIVWFNENKERDWRADASTSISAAFAPWLDATPAASAPAAGDAAPAPPPTPKPTPEPAPAPAPGSTPSAGGATNPAAGTTNPAAGTANPAADGARSPSASNRLRLRASRRMRAGRSSTLRWSTTGARTASSSPRVARWVILLDGRRIRTIKASSAQRLRHRIASVGTHRWRVEGRAADGRRVLSATLAFRALRAR